MAPGARGEMRTFRAGLIVALLLEGVMFHTNLSHTSSIPRLHKGLTSPGIVCALIVGQKKRDTIIGKSMYKMRGKSS